MQEMAEEEERQRKRDEKDGTVNSVVLLKGEGEGNTGNEVDNFVYRSKKSEIQLGILGFH